MAQLVHSVRARALVCVPSAARLALVRRLVRRLVRPLVLVLRRLRSHTTSSHHGALPVLAAPHRDRYTMQPRTLNIVNGLVGAAMT
jgi:hypothetical protein